MTVGINQNTFQNTGWIYNNPSNTVIIPHTPQIFNQTAYPAIPSAYYLIYTQPQDAPLTPNQKTMLFNSLPIEDKMEIISLSDYLTECYPSLLGKKGATVTSFTPDSSSDTLKKYKKFFESQDIKLIFPKVGKDADTEFLAVINIPEAKKNVEKNIDYFRKRFNNQDLTVEDIVNKFLDVNNNLLDISDEKNPDSDLRGVLLGYPLRDCYMYKLTSDTSNNRIDAKEAHEMHDLFALQDGKNPTNYTKILGLVCNILDNDKSFVDGKISNVANGLIYYILRPDNYDFPNTELIKFRPQKDKLDTILKNADIKQPVILGEAFPIVCWDADFPEVKELMKKDEELQTEHKQRFNTAEKSFGYFLNS